MPDVDKITKLFNKYRASIRIIQKSVMLMSGLSVELEITLMSDQYYTLLDDLELGQQLKEEEILRSNNPTLNRAYEEYQILLKLIKQ